MAVQLCLVVILMVISFGGNATVGALLMRFKKLRTIPNILIANMALVDKLNSIINMPIFVLHSMLQVHSFMRPKANAFTIGFLYALSLGHFVVRLTPPVMKFSLIFEWIMHRWHVLLDDWNNYYFNNFRIQNSTDEYHQKVKRAEAQTQKTLRLRRENVATWKKRKRRTKPWWGLRLWIDGTIIFFEFHSFKNKFIFLMQTLG